MALLQFFYNKLVDEEGYENLSGYKKNNFYNFATGDGNFISLPKPRELAVTDSLFERMLEYANGNDEAFYDFGGYLAQNLLPPAIQWTPTLISGDFKNVAQEALNSTPIGGFVDIGTNRDFKGTPIESVYDEYYPSNERYDESTTKIAYALGQTKFARDRDLSPKQIDHLISSYTGILGQVNKALFPMNEERRDVTIGLRNKFISDSNYSTDVLNKMYDNKDATELRFQYEPNIENALEYEQNAVVTSYTSEMLKAIKALPEEERRNGRKFLLKSLNSWNYELTKPEQDMVKKFDGVNISDDMIFTELPSSELSWTVDGKKYVYQMSPQEYNDYINVYVKTINNARKQLGGSTEESYEGAKEAAKKYMSDYKKYTLKTKYLEKAKRVKE